jgi:AraC-like DNA-binding protein
MDHNLYKPHPALQKFVLNITTVDISLPEELNGVITPYPPTPHQSIIFYGDDRLLMQSEKSGIFNLQPSTVIVGPQFTRVNLLVKKRLRAVRVDFHPGGLYRLLGIPMNLLFDDGFDALDLLGNEIKIINEQILESKDLEACKTIVENYLLKKLKILKESLPFDEAMRHLMLHNGNLPIDKVSNYACLGLRQFERKCNERIGMPPKAFARIIRFSNAYQIREANPHVTWTTIAHTSGYYDQMHMIRDFKEFTGVTPRIMDQSLSGTPFRMQANLIV